LSAIIKVLMQINNSQTKPRKMDTISTKCNM